MKIKKKSISYDGTIKYRILINKNEIVEACLIFFDNNEIAKANICVSSQIFCSFCCSFCISGYEKLIRNLSSSEIFEQVKIILEDENKKLKNLKTEVTYMGSGEPYDNLDNVLSSANRIINEIPNNIRINISTILPTTNVDIEKFKDFIGKVHIQFSMHFVSDKLREKYFRFKLPRIKNSLEYLDKLSKYLNDKFCVNYILFDNINDSVEDALALCSIVKKYNAYLKLSVFNKIDNCDLLPSNNFEIFINIVEKSGIEYKIFKSKGQDINAACGSLLKDYHS